MTKIILNDLSTISGNEQSAINLINANNAVIETASDNTLSRDGTSPNQMLSNLDMNSFRILNCVDAINLNEPATYNQVLSFISSALTPGTPLLGPGIATWLTTPTSANLAAAVTGETGTGALVFATSPVLSGTPTAPTATAQTNTTQIATTAYVVNQTREKLVSNRTYFVRTDGSDSNTGLVNTSGGAFLTIQKAYNTIKNTLDLGGNSAIIQVADGTYTGGLLAYGPLVGGGGSQLFLLGNTVTPTNVVINTTSANAIQCGGGAYVQVQGFQLKTTTAGSCIFCYENGQVDFFNCNFGATTGGIHVETKQHGRVNAIANYAISGGAVAHIHAYNQGFFSMVSAVGTVSGTPAFSSFFTGVSFANAAFAAASFSGAATGSRYFSHNNGFIDTSGGGANFFPGDVAGTTATGGLYA